MFFDYAFLLSISFFLSLSFFLSFVIYLMKSYHSRQSFFFLSIFLSFFLSFICLFIQVIFFAIFFFLSFFRYLYIQVIFFAISFFLSWHFNFVAFCFPSPNTSFFLPFYSVYLCISFYFFLSFEYFHILSFLSPFSALYHFRSYLLHHSFISFFLSSMQTGTAFSLVFFLMGITWNTICCHVFVYSSY